MVLAMMGILTAAILSGAMSSIGATRAEYQSARTFYAAEASAEAALAQLVELLRDGSLDEEDLATITPPPLSGFNLDGFSIELIDTALVETITDGPYTGLYALTQVVKIYAPAMDKNEALSAIELQAKAQAIPLFQFGVFFDGDLEATNGPPMVFEGRIHSNGGIYLSSANAWYREPITTPKKVYHRRKDKNGVKDGVFIDNDAGEEVNFDFDSELIPDSEAFKFRSCEQFDCRLRTDAFGVDPLNLPLPEGVRSYELLLPRDGADSDGEREVKFAWTADTRVLVDLTDVKPTPEQCGGGGGGEIKIPRVTILRDGLEVPNASTTCDIFAFEWAAFYDGREKELKEVLNIDIDAMLTWVGLDPDRAMWNVYVEFNLPASIAVYSSEIKSQIMDASIDVAVRVVNGQTLPNPLTVATEWPIYALGDYNNFAKKPAALVGDGITILSNSWSDAQNRPDDDDFEECEEEDDDDEEGCSSLSEWAESEWSMKRASRTTVYAAILAGHWATPCDWVEAGCLGGYQNWYGGGIENFPRFLERWRDASNNKVTFEYRGALISPFTSEKTTGTWNGTYYAPPQREWSFDTDFRNPTLLPPGTPNVGVILRSAFREAF